MSLHHVQSSLWLPRPREEVFDFFSDAGNLELLTPPWLHFQVLTPRPIDLHAGTVIQYRLKLHGLPLRWDSEISVWEPPYRFVDTQLRGPYRRWVHEHRFVEHAGGTLVTDHVTYDVLGGALVQRLFVAPDLRKIFAYRRERLVERFGERVGEPRADERPAPMGTAATLEPTAPRSSHA
jgi:ligand-binding SRPBCC domain-containing protein